MCPILTADGCYALIIPSPKCSDLLRDGHYTMHSFPCDDNEDAFSIDGVASRCDDTDLRARLDAQFMSERHMTEKPPGFEEQTLFEFRIASCMLTRTTGHGDPNPVHTIWRAGA
jgi:hypothetical protein